MTATDALDRVWTPMGKKAKREFAKTKADEELTKTLQDPRKTSVLASKFEQEVNRQRKELGLCELKHAE
jgi:hypothetical protein